MIRRQGKLISINCIQYIIKLSNYYAIIFFWIIYSNINNRSPSRFLFCIIIFKIWVKTFWWSPIPLQPAKYRGISIKVISHWERAGNSVRKFFFSLENHCFLTEKPLQSHWEIGWQISESFLQPETIIPIIYKHSPDSL